MPGICPVSTLIPVPARKPTSTAVERKSPRNPSRAILATASISPVTIAINDAKPNHSAEFGCRPATPMPAMPDPMIAAVAESAPVTMSRDAPRTANTIVGRMMV